FAWVGRPSRPRCRPVQARRLDRATAKGATALRATRLPVLPSDGWRFCNPTFGILSTYPPTACGLATFSSALGGGLSTHGAQVRVIRIADRVFAPSDNVVGALLNGSPASVAAC